MNIGIYKAGRTISFKDNDVSDHSAISVEITRIAKILAEHLHNVFILSDTDYIPKSITRVSRDVPEALDKVFIYNGVGLTADIVNSCLKYTDDVNLIVTDLALLPSSDVVTMFKKLYTQSKRFGEYGAIQEHELYKCKIKRRNKYAGLYFGGTERGRLQDFLEYVYRPNVTWFGKSDTLGIKNYIPYHEHIEWMKKSKYSIVIGDSIYNKVGFVTPRYYECIRYGMIPFVDMKYDPDEIMIKKDDYRRVSSFEEVLTKMKHIDGNQALYHQLLDEQEQMMTDELFYGDNIISYLLG